MPEFFLKVNYEDVSHRKVVERKRVSVFKLQGFFKDFVSGDIDIHRIDSIHIERLTNEN